MIRLLLRGLVIVYLVLPVVAGVVLISAAREMIDTVTPVYTAAANSIEQASDRLDNSLGDLRDEFQPLVSAVNTLRSGLNTINNFISNSVNDVIEEINKVPFVNIPDFNGITIPSIINLNFLDDISDDVSLISTQIGATISTTTTVVSTQLSNLLIGLALIGAWLVLTQVLVIAATVRSLWR